MLHKCSMQNVLSVFFDSPSTRFAVLEISRRIQLAHTSIANNLKILMKKGLVSRVDVKRGLRVFPEYIANKNSLEFKRYKKEHNISALIESGLVSYIDNQLMPRSIVLFGSYARGEDIETSDIDLFIECDFAEVDFTLFEKKLGRKIQLHFNPDFSSYPKELKNNIINGVTLHGFLEGYKK